MYKICQVFLATAPPVSFGIPFNLPETSVGPIDIYVRWGKSCATLPLSEMPPVVKSILLIFCPPPVWLGCGPSGRPESELSPKLWMGDFLEKITAVIRDIVTLMWHQFEQMYIILHPITQNYINLVLIHTNQT